MKTGIYWQDPKYALRPGRDFIFDPSLVLYLPLHKLDGASIMSRDPYGHLCSVTGALWTPNGREFDGIDDEIDCGNNSILDFTSGDFSIDLWINQASSPLDNAYIINRGNYNLSGWYIWFWNAGNEMQFYTNQDTPGVQSTTMDMTFDTWLHLALVRSGTVATWYQNTVDVTKNHGIHIDPTSVSQALKIGAFPSDDFKGTIGEVRIYNRVLTPLEIQRNYLATKWRYQ